MPCTCVPHGEPTTSEHHRLPPACLLWRSAPARQLRATGWHDWHAALFPPARRRCCAGTCGWPPHVPHGPAPSTAASHPPSTPPPARSCWQPTAPMHPAAAAQLAAARRVPQQALRLCRRPWGACQSMCWMRSCTWLPTRCRRGPLWHKKRPRLAHHTRCALPCKSLLGYRRERATRGTGIARGGRRQRTGAGSGTC